MQTLKQKQDERKALQLFKRALDIRSANTAIREERWDDAERWLDKLDFVKDNLSLKQRIALYCLIGVNRKAASDENG